MDIHVQNLDRDELIQGRNLDGMGFVRRAFDESR
jgi:hypothetical protein